MMYSEISPPHWIHLLLRSSRQPRAAPGDPDPDLHHCFWTRALTGCVFGDFGGKPELWESHTDTGRKEKHRKTIFLAAR